jgi:palmitoyl-protein thioesterase
MKNPIKIIALLLVATCACINLTAKTLPVVLVHGIWSTNRSMNPTVKFIQKYLPDAYIKNIEIGHGKISSIRNLESQAEDLRKQLEKDPKLKDGCNIIGYSQGGLIARYFIEKYNNPKVYNFITWGCPHMGIYGEYKTLSILYYRLLQYCLSIAGYWHNPLNQQGYLTYCSFLPYLNNEKEHANTDLYKKNICQLNNLVLVQSTQDDRIKPVESSQFGFYKENSIAEIVPLLESDLYKKDLLGLKILNETGRLHFQTASCQHKDFPRDEENFIKNTLPFLATNP